MAKNVTVLVLALLCLVANSFGAPTAVRMVPVFINDNGPYLPQTRGPLDFIGDWIQSSSWFPIQINVPDTLSSIGQGVSMGWTNLGNTVNGWVQGLPWFNRFPNLQTNPRPMKYFIMVPVDKNAASLPQGPSPALPFNPFENELNQFPAFP